MQCSITEIRFTSPGGKVNVYLLCKPQYILEASPAGPVAKGLPGKLHPPPPPSPPPLSPFAPLSNPPTPLKLPWVYVPGRPVNFLSRVHRYADINGISLLLRIVMPMQMYTRLLSVIAVYCGSGCGFTQEIFPPLSVDNTDEGRTDIWDKLRPNCVAGDTVTVVVNKWATL